jgi:hypothetical protein
MNIKKFCIVNNKVKSIDEDGELFIKGIANTGERDLVGDVITETALQEIAEQAVNRNLHFNHSGRFDDTLDDLTESIIGVITESQLVAEGVEITARILPKHSANIKYLLENGVRLGLSVSGHAHYEENSFEQIISWDLTEISLTAIPCDQGTMGTVQIQKSFTEFIQSIPEQKTKNGGKSMSEDGISKEDVIELINTAFNEKEGELLEVVRKENEQKFDEIIARIESLETQASVSGDEDDETPQDEDTPQNEEEEEEDEGKNIEDLVNKKVEEIFHTIFKGVQTPEFQYRTKQMSTPDEEDEEDEEPENKTYTVKEIAEAIARRN